MIAGYTIASLHRRPSDEPECPSERRAKAVAWLTAHGVDVDLATLEQLEEALQQLGPDDVFMGFIPTRLIPKTDIPTLKGSAQ